MKTAREPANHEGEARTDSGESKGSTRITCDGLADTRVMATLRSEFAVEFTNRAQNSKTRKWKVRHFLHGVELDAPDALPTL